MSSGRSTSTRSERSARLSGSSDGAIPGVDVAVDIVLIIEFGLDILQTAADLYDMFTSAGVLVPRQLGCRKLRQATAKTTAGDVAFVTRSSRQCAARRNTDTTMKKLILLSMIVSSSAFAQAKGGAAAGAPAVPAAKPAEAKIVAPPEVAERAKGMTGTWKCAGKAELGTTTVDIKGTAAHRPTSMGSGSRPR